MPTPISEGNLSSRSSAGFICLKHFGYLIALDVIMQQPMEVSERPA